MNLDYINRFDIGEMVFFIQGNTIKKGMVWGKHFGNDYKKSTDIVTYIIEGGVKVDCHCLFSTRQEAIDALVDIISQNE